MAVSKQHERLVAHIINWVQSKYSESGDLCIYADHIDWPSHLRPRPMNGFVPDVYAIGINHPLVILGEAETARSIELPHCLQQIDRFVDFLAYQINPVLVVAVPWVALPHARGLVRRSLKRNENPKIEVAFLERLE